jgi:homocysteine S-methyltransferase
LLQGFVGSRGDAYNLNHTITTEEAEDYHSIQLSTLKDADVDRAWTFTFNNVPEAIGVTRAEETLGIPLAISFTLDSTSQLKSGPTLAEEIAKVDAKTNDAPGFYAINCSHPTEFEPALTPDLWIERIRSIRPNASKTKKIALCKLGVSRRRGSY